MGLLNKMFGGGTNMTLQLDASRLPAGGVLSGRATVSGGKKDLELNSLSVRLHYVRVTSKEDSAMPDIDTKTLINQTIATAQALPAGVDKTFTFQFRLPDGLQPSAHDTRYTVQVTADIPKVADPTAEAKLEIIEGAASGDGAGLDEVYERWPALRGAQARPLIDALRDFSLACYSERERLIVAEPLIAGLMRSGDRDVATAAIEAWSNLLDGQVRKEHLKALQSLAEADLDAELTHEVIRAAAKFADEGALSFVQRFAQHPDASVRRQMAESLRFAAADQFKGKRDLLVAMSRDPDHGVRAAVFGALSDYRDDKKIIELCLQNLDMDPSPDVQASIIGALALAHHYGMGEATLQAYERHLGNPHETVRKAIAESINWLPREQLARVGPIVQRLLGDASEDVRRAMAWQFCNMSEFPELAPLLLHTVDHDPASAVRKAALGSISAVVPAPQAVALYRHRLQHEPVEETYWAVLNGSRFREDPQFTALLQELSGCPFSDVAQSARDALAHA